MRRLLSGPPPPPLRAIHKSWRSPIRGPWLTSVFGAALLVGIPIMVVTGLVSYVSYEPRLGHNDTTPNAGLFHLFLFNWISSPSWIYRLSQGIHVTLGVMLTPILLAKLWSVIPKLFEWPALRSVAHALERLSLLTLVAGALVEFATGIANINYFYPWKFSFYAIHFYGAWIFLGGFVVHVTLKLPTMISALRGRSIRDELHRGLADTLPEPADGGGLVPLDPAAPTISRRGVLGLVGASSLGIFVLTVGGTLGGPFRRIALLSPRQQSYGDGPNDFQVNRTAKSAGITEDGVGDAWQLTLRGTKVVSFSRAELLAMDQVTAALPIACVEGWSTVQTWTGVPLVHLARLAGVEHPSTAAVESLERGGGFNRATLDGEQVGNGHTLLALRVNGADLSMDHGYPARMIIPGAPGVHNTKWVQQITFATAGEAPA
jgi:DMSO/TMAO reductase YedYZ molybdopterin-dependent catalytic subunit